MTSKNAAAPRPPAGVSLDDQLDWLRSMWEIRYFEEECHRLFAQGLVRGSTHICQGPAGSTTPSTSPPNRPNLGLAARRAVRVVEVHQRGGGLHARRRCDPRAQHVDLRRLNPQRVDPCNNRLDAGRLKSNRRRLQVALRLRRRLVTPHEAHHRQPQRRLQADRGRLGRQPAPAHEAATR